VDLSGVVAGQQRLGVNLVSLIVALREEGRLPLRTIQWYLQTVHQLHLSVGGIVQVLHGVAQQAQGAVAEVLEQVRASPVVQADETGWREDGANGYVWTFSTPTERYFLRRGRGKAVVDEVLDESFGGVLVSDFYAAYHHYPGVKQSASGGLGPPAAGRP
jgi:transposase